MANDEDLLGPAGRSVYDDSPLRKLFLLACPPHPSTGKKSIHGLAKAIDLTDEAIYRWIRQNTLPANQAARIVDVAEGRVTLGDLSPYYLFDNLDA